MFKMSKITRMVKSLIIKIFFTYSEAFLVRDINDKF